MTVSTGSLPSLQAFPTWIYLKREGVRVGRSSMLVSPYRFPNAISVRSVGSLMSAGMLARPLPNDSDYRHLKTFDLGGGFEVDVDLLAGGSLDEVRLDGRPMLNTHRGWTRGWQSGLDFTRFTTRCLPRTGGSVYSGDQATHTKWWLEALPPAGAIGTLDSTLAAFNDNERQGAWNESIGLRNGTLRIATVPIELDPDGFCGGSDHQILETTDTATPTPEQLVPVLYHGIRFVTSMRLVSPGVVEVKVEVDLPGRAELPIDQTWKFDVARLHLKGEPTPSLLRVGATTYILDAELIPGGGGDTYADPGEFYVLERNIVRRGTDPPVASTLANNATSTLIREACGRFIGIRTTDSGVRDKYGNVLGATRSHLYSDRTDLLGDPRAGDKHNFLGSRFQMAENLIRSGTTATIHVVFANTLAEMEARIDAIV